MEARIVLIVLFALFLFSCKRGNLQDHARGSANEYMHRSSVEALIANFESPERDAYQQPEKVIDYLGEIQDLRIMDLGSGSGYFSFRLAKAGAQVIAADVNDEFQAYIREKITKNELDLLGIELRKLPYDSPSLQVGEVDKVLVVNTYHHIENRIDYFKEVLTGLKPGGELVVIDYFKKKIPVGPPSGHKIARNVVIKELNSAGFMDLDVNTDLLKYQYIIRAK